MVKQLQDADFLSFMIDESCDIANLKKLSVYAKTVKDCKAETVFVENVEIEDGKADTITAAVSDLIQKSKIKPVNVIGLGSAGASVCTLMLF